MWEKTLNFYTSFSSKVYILLLLKINLNSCNFSSLHSCKFFSIFYESSCWTGRWSSRSFCDNFFNEYCLGFEVIFWISTQLLLDARWMGLKWTVYNDLASILVCLSDWRDFEVMRTKRSVKRKVFYVAFFPSSHQANYSFVCCKQASRNWSCKFYFKNHKNCSKVESSYQPPLPPSLHFLLTTKILINFYANFAITESVLQCFALFSGNNKTRSRIHIQLWACFSTSGTANMCQWRWLGSIVRWMCTTTIPPLLHFPSTSRDEFFGLTSQSVEKETRTTNLWWLHSSARLLVSRSTLF